MSIIGGPPATTSPFGRWQAGLHNNLRKSHIQIGIVVFLISILSFGLGYIFGRDVTPTPIIIETVSE